MENQVHIPVDASLHARMVAASERYHTDEQELFRRAAEEFLAKGDAYEIEKHEDEQRLRRYRETGEHVSHEAMKLWVDGLRARSPE